MEQRYKAGDVVFLVELKYLNQAYAEYRHRINEHPCYLRVRITRTIVKSVVGWKKIAEFPYYRCLLDEEYPGFKLYGTIYDALESLPVSGAMKYCLMEQVPVMLNKACFNITRPSRWEHMFSLIEIHATMESA